MLSRREFLQVTAATAAIIPNLSRRALAQQKLTQAELLTFEPLGNVTLLHVTDVHGQLMPVYFREPSINLGVGYLLPIGRNLGLRFEARGYATLLNNSSSMFCGSNAGCVVSIQGTALYQGEALIGLSGRF